MSKNYYCSGRMSQDDLNTLTYYTALKQGAVLAAQQCERYLSEEQIELVRAMLPLPDWKEEDKVYLREVV